MTKRLFDVVLAALALLLFSPIMIVIAIAIRLNLGSPILFRQARPGLNAEPFTIYKFRTMREARAADGSFLSDEIRLTNCGRVLRRLSLDELPQFVNVLKGDISLVGPRPLLMEYLPRYTKVQMRRHEVRPGITGWAQVNGRNAITWEEKFRLDVWYVDHQSFWLDLRILMLTVEKIFRSNGVSQPGRATAEKFMGTSEVGDN